VYLMFKIPEKRQTVKRREKRVVGQCPANAPIRHILIEPVPA
jgi:hypothetical protein